MAGAVNELLEREVVTVEKLVNNEAFTTAVLHATQVAVRTSKREKHEMLRNALLNSALPLSPEEDFQVAFIHLIDVLTTMHIRVLDRFRGRLGYFKVSDAEDGIREQSDYILIAMASFPEIDKFPRHFANDLLVRGLLEVEQHIGVDFLVNVTDFGLEFLQFVNSPDAIAFED